MTTSPEAPRRPAPGELLRRPAWLLAFGFGAGLAPRAPGTVGTVLGAVLYVPLAGLAPAAYLAVLAAGFALGVWACGRAARDLGVHDHPGIVWDEVVGFWVAMALAPPGWGWMAAGFVAFRVLDIAKPWPIAWADRRVTGGLGIMLDDLLAGLGAGVALALAHALSSPA